MSLLKAVLITLCAATCCIAGPAKSAMVPVPKTIADSLPWFAVREVSSTNSPFTKTHLTQLARQNERVALVYFATWCIPCREGVKRLAAAQDQLKKNKVDVVLVNIGENDEKVIGKWVDKLGASNFKVIVDPFRRMTENFGIVGEGEEMSLPKTLVVDQQVKPVYLIGQEGNDWPQILWAK
ncbi:MAG: TlpA family protein disulfide reductase [Fibrobacter sp.]|nr:TlpA family protein disulfide reductase [Fibrobacter sp.]